MTRQELRVFLDKLYCGCGDPESASRSLLRLLEQFSDRNNEPAYLALPKWISDDGVMFLTLYWMSDLGLIEHGGGVLASWLTGLGSDVLKALRRESIDDFDGLHAMHCIHGYDMDDKIHDCAAVQ